MHSEHTFRLLSGIGTIVTTFDHFQIPSRNILRVVIVDINVVIRTIYFLLTFRPFFVYCEPLDKALLPERV